MQGIAFRDPPCSHPGVKFKLHGSLYEQTPWNPRGDKWHFTLSIKLRCDLCEEILFRPLHRRWETIFDPFWAFHEHCDVTDDPCPMAMGIWNNGLCDHQLTMIVDAKDIEVVSKIPYPRELDGVYRCELCNYVYVQHKVYVAPAPSLSETMMPMIAKFFGYFLIGAVGANLIQAL